eukprot:COSAG06_NODE_23820_length_680_cov_1.648881_1_plen_135_part_10
MRLALIAIWVGLVPIAKQHAVTTAKQVRHVMCHENVARLTIATTIVWPCVQGNMHPKGANVFADRPLLRLQDAGATPQAAMAMGTAPKLKGGGGGGGGGGTVDVWGRLRGVGGVGGRGGGGGGGGAVGGRFWVGG